MTPYSSPGVCRRLQAAGHTRTPKVVNAVVAKCRNNDKDPLGAWAEINRHIKGPREQGPAGAGGGLGGFGATAALAWFRRGWPGLTAIAAGAS